MAGRCPIRFSADFTIDLVLRHNFAAKFMQRSLKQRPRRYGTAGRGYSF
jgi:hypothetical protein